MADVLPYATKYGWAHDDGTACQEPAWCSRRHVSTVIVAGQPDPLYGLKAVLTAAIEELMRRDANPQVVMDNVRAAFDVFEANASTREERS